MLGALVLFPSPNGEQKFKVQIHFLFSDDSTQDSHAWNCAKEVLYGMLEKMGIKKFTRELMVLEILIVMKERE